MIELTYTTAVEILDGLVEEFGSDYVYEKGENGKCSYVRGGCPDCIVGHVLARVGVPIERLATADTAHFNGGQAAGRLLNNLRYEGVLKFDGSVRTLLNEVQSAQDSSYTWGESLAIAKRHTQF